MRHRPLATVAAAALVLGAVAGPAAARSTASNAAPAAGTATSALSLLTLALAGHTAELGRVALTSDTTSGDPAAKVVVTPLTVDGTAYGEQTVTPGTSPASVPAVDSATVVPAALSPLIGAKSPVINASASTADGASSKAGAASLGSVSVLGLPIALDGSVDVSSVVSSTNALGQKSVTVKNLALPSVADLLAALGLDLPKLPIETLSKLLKDLGLVTTAVTTAQQALDAASVAFNAQIADTQAKVNAAQAQLAAATADLDTRLAALDAAKADLTPLQAAVNAAKAANDQAIAAQTAAASAITASLVGGMTFAQFLLLPSQLATDYNTATALVTSTGSALAQAQTAADAAQVVVNTAQGAVDAAQQLVTTLQKTVNDLLALLKSILANVQPQLDALLGAITAVLDGTPLVSIDSITVETQALVESAVAGGQAATVTGGEIVGLKVVGTDVLQNVLGSTKVDLLDLVGGTLSQVTSTINGLTGTLSSVLSNVPAFPALSVPAPQVGVLTKSTGTSIAGGFGLAENSVKALTVTIPAITLPAALALPNASSLPALSGLPVGGVTDAVTAGTNLVSKPIALSLGTLSEQSKFRPAVTAAPTTPGSSGPGQTPQLPSTGLPAGVALVALLLVGTGLVLQRRLAAGA